MPIKKTVQRKTATKAAARPTTKHVAPAKVVETKKPTVIVETKKTDRCECGDNCTCNCGSSCNCCLKVILLILIVANLVVVLLSYFKKSPWDLTVLSLWWIENEEKLVNGLYSNENYAQLQSNQIPSLSDYWIE